MTGNAWIPSPEAVARLRKQAGFADAMRAAAQSMVVLYRSDRLLNALLNDRARALLSHLALYLHYAGDGSGLAVGAMKDMAVKLGLSYGDSALN